MSKNKKNPARKKTGTDEWRYYSQSVGAHCELYKSRHNGMYKTQLAASKDGTWAKISNITVRGDWVYFDATEEYSEFVEEHREYNRYSTVVTYRIMKDGKNLEYVESSGKSSLSTSN